MIIGAARQGTALARFLAEEEAQVTLTDLRTADELQEVQDALSDLPINWVLGEHPLSLLDGADYLCPSGGVPLKIPLVKEALARGITLTNDSQIFLEENPGMVIGVTGSAGKTTTTTLVGRMGAADKEKYKRTFVGGNIGSPLIAELGEMTPNDLSAMELSSFQLEIMTRSPQVAVITNIAPNHLDRHGTMEAYVAAKLNILNHQSKEDAAVLWRDDEEAWALKEHARGKMYSFGLTPLAESQLGSFLRDEIIWVQTEAGEVEVMPVSEVGLRGAHNLLNVLAACAAASAAGLPAKAMRAGTIDFGGVPHRLEFVRTWGGAAWYNDSKATTPDAAVTAIRAFDEPLVVLAGGRDKHLPWEDFARTAKERVAHLILFGEAADVIQQALDDSPPYSLAVCPGLTEAVRAAADVVSPGDVVLLAPGGTSFDEFSDFEARGQFYIELVLALPE